MTLEAGPSGDDRALVELPGEVGELFDAVDKRLAEEVV